MGPVAAAIESMVPPDEARWAVRQGHNVLIIGSPVVTGNLLRALRAEVRLPICEFGCASGLPRLDGAPTLVAHDVPELDPTEQRVLLGWLDDYGAERQVISLTTEPVFPLVQRGAFLEALYYRLNVVTVECVI
jgi:hypothetical protein